MWGDWGIASHLLWLFRGRVNNRELCVGLAAQAQGFTCCSWEQLKHWCQGRTAGPSLEFNTALGTLQETSSIPQELMFCPMAPVFNSSVAWDSSSPVSTGWIWSSPSQEFKVQVHHYLKPAHICRAGTRTVPPLFPPVAKPQAQVLPFSPPVETLLPLSKNEK